MEKMKKRKISKKAVLASIKSPRTPNNLKMGLKKMAKRYGWFK